jgi:membrane-bound metal-dependent hydrolase YbcI (DUF457 family)
MFAVGHLSLGYLFAKASARSLKVEVDLSLVFLLSLIPDIDLIVPGLVHRTVTHSIVVSIIVFLPFFVFYKARAVPYFLALVQHGLVGDFIVGAQVGVQLLWPLTLAYYGLPISMYSSVDIVLELSSFLVAGAVMLKTGDVKKLLKGRFSHLSLILPTFTVILPTLIQFPLTVPTTLVVPHIAYLVLFTLSMANVFCQFRF